MKYDLYGSNLKRLPGMNKDRIISILLAIALVIVLSVRLDPATADPQLSVVTYDCAPAMEMDMPIDVGRVQL